MKRCWKGFISFCLVVCMCCTLCNGVLVFAANESYVYEGNHSLKIHTVSGGGFASFGQTVNTLSANTDYMVTFWAKGHPGRFRVLQENWSTVVTEINLDSNGNEWTQYTAEFNSGSLSKIICAFTNNTFAGNGDLYIDNMILSKKGEAENLLLNPGFEEGESSWGSWNDVFSLVTSDASVTPGEPTPTVEPGDTPTSVPTGTTGPTNEPGGSDENMAYIYEGNHSLKIHTESTSGFTVFGQTINGISPDTDYVATFWAKGKPGNFRILQNNWSTMLKEQSVNSSEWRQYSVSFNSGSNSELVYVFTNNPYAGNGDLYIDNLTLCKDGENENLLLNPGFEEGEVNWGTWSDIFSLVTSQTAVTPGDPTATTEPETTSTPTPTTTATATATAGPTQNPEGSDENVSYVYEGYNSMKIHSEGLGNEEKYIFFTQYVRNLEPNTDYVVKFYAKGRSGTVRMLNSNWQSYTDYVTLGGSEWKEYTLEFSSGNEDTLIVAFTGNPYGGQGDIYIDKVSFCKKGDSVNLLANPGFEEGETVWGKWEYPISLVRSSKHMTDGKVTDGSEPPEELEEVDISDAPGGNASLDLYVGPRSLVFDADGSGQEGKVTQNIAIEKNTDYVAMLWVKNADGVKAEFDVTGSAGTSVLESGAIPIEKNGSWKRLVAYFNSGENTTAGFTITATANVEGRVCFDYGTFYTRYKPVSQKTPTNLLLNPDFDEQENEWKGITYPFSIHYDNEGKSGDISGGVRVMCVGDSITSGVGAVQQSGGYKYDLFQKYLDDGANVNFVGPNSLGNEYGKGSGHAGNSGWRIDQVASNIESWMYNYGPQVILLMIGTNDVLQDNEENNLFAGAPERMEALVDQILEMNPDIQLYVATVTPLDNASNEAKVRQYNEFLTTMLPTKGENVHLVNMHDALTLADISEDHTHPNDSGYIKIAQTWFDATHEMIKTMVPSDFEPDKGITHTGVGALQYTPYYVPYYTLQKYFFTTQYLYVEKNTDYKVRYWIKGDQGLSLQIRMQKSSKSDYSWGDVITSKESACGPKWMEVEFTFNSGDTDLVLFSMVHSCRAKGTMYIDDISVVKADDPEETNLIKDGGFEEENSWKPAWPFALVRMTEGDIVRENVEITKDGAKLNTLESGDIQVTADLSDTSLSGVLVVAVYQDDVLQTYGLSEQGDGKLTAQVTVGEVNESTELKVMLWDSMDSITPQMSPIEITT